VEEVLDAILDHSTTGHATVASLRAAGGFLPLEVPHVALCRSNLRVAVQEDRVLLVADLVGAGDQRWRQIEAHGARGLHIDDQLKPVQLLDRELGRIGAL
jgi:hypothetical protein